MPSSESIVVADRYDVILKQNGMMMSALLLSEEAYVCLEDAICMHSFLPADMLVHEY